MTIIEEILSSMALGALTLHSTSWVEPAIRQVLSEDKHLTVSVADLPTEVLINVYTIRLGRKRCIGTHREPRWADQAGLEKAATQIVGWAQGLGFRS